MMTITLLLMAAQAACLCPMLWHMRAMDQAAKRRAEAVAEFASALRASARETEALLARMRDRAPRHRMRLVGERGPELEVTGPRARA